MNTLLVRFPALALGFALFVGGLVGAVDARPSGQEVIKAYCLDFNWAPTARRGKPFAKPGLWAAADPAEHVAWYQAMGANVIQTFCVSTNGYAWYKGGFIPEQPGLKHDFLPEVVKLGHAGGMKVFGYFCISSNPRWAELHPEQSYGAPTTYHIPYTDDYLDYLSKSIADAVKKTGIDGFMIDWVWMPKRESTDGKWLQCEKKLYQKLMGEAFPGEDQLTNEQDTDYSRKAIDRCWKAIHKAAKGANPECLIWLTVNHMDHPHVVDSDMYKEADWLMNEAGSVEAIEKVRPMVGKHTRLITCLAVWNGMDASVTVPAASEAGVGLYGFTAPRNNNGLVPLDGIFEKQVTELSGDDKNIAVLARAYRGKSEHALWQDGSFVESSNPPPFRLTFQGRGRGLQDTATVQMNGGKVEVVVKTPYGKGAGTMKKTDKAWPKEIVIQLEKKPGEAPTTPFFGISAGTTGVIVPLGGSAPAVVGEIDPNAKPGKAAIRFVLKGKTEELEVPVERDGKSIRVVVPATLLESDLDMLSFQWGE